MAGCIDCYNCSGKGSKDSGEGTLRKYRMDKKAYRFYSSFILVKQYAIYEQLQMVT